MFKSPIRKLYSSLIFSIIVNSVPLLSLFFSRPFLPWLHFSRRSFPIIRSEPTVPRVPYANPALEIIQKAQLYLESVPPLHRLHLWNITKNSGKRSKSRWLTFMFTSLINSPIKVPSRNVQKIHKKIMEKFTLLKNGHRTKNLSGGRKLA